MLPGSRVLIRVHAHPGFQVWAPRPLIGVRTHWGTLGLVPRKMGRLSGLTLTRGFMCGPLDALQPHLS